MTLGQLFLQELNMEVASTRKCLERLPDGLKEYKPHEKSMKMGNLMQVVAEIPRWISHMIEKGDIDFATWERFEWNTVAELVKFYDDNVAAARAALEKVNDKYMQKDFSLLMNGQVLMKTTMQESMMSSLNHWVHHRGQLTVYMKLNNIAIPSIYGPSADENTF